MLGVNLLQQVLKDYNGQTYWLAFDIKPWLRKESHFPAWLNLSLGYGAQELVYANDHKPATGIRFVPPVFSVAGREFYPDSGPEPAGEESIFPAEHSTHPNPGSGAEPERGNQVIRFHPVYF